MKGEEHFRKLGNMYAAAPSTFQWPSTIRIEEGRSEVVIPIQAGYLHGAGAAHGAICFKAMDDAAFFAVSSLVEDVFVLTVSFTVYFIRPVSKGSINAVGRVVHASRRLFLADSEVVDSEGRPIAKGNGAFMRSSIPLGPEVGYR
jgi:uncharacterized protein (TIGR00369 family)